MKTLTKKERSLELNNLNRTLIDFKSLVSDNKFIIYKSGGLVYYIFDVDGYFKITKKDEFLELENFLEDNEYFRVNYSELKGIVGLKKSEILDIKFAEDSCKIDMDIESVKSQYIMIKHEDVNDVMKKTIGVTAKDKLNRDFVEAEYNSRLQILTTKTDPSTVYPYKITFSDDINFKLKIDDPNSLYYVRPLNEGAFLQVITVSEYKEIYEAETMIFVFNYLNNRGV